LNYLHDVPLTVKNTPYEGEADEPDAPEKLLRDLWVPFNWHG